MAVELTTIVDTVESHWLAFGPKLCKLICKTFGVVVVGPSVFK